MNKSLSLQLADCFSKHLRQHVTPEQLRKINLRNMYEPDHRVCHSGDFCDSNMPMLDAAWEVGLMPRGEYRADDQHVADVMNEAWTHAKTNRFLPMDEQPPEEPFERLGQAIRKSYYDLMDETTEAYLLASPPLTAYNNLPPCYAVAEYLQDVIEQSAKIIEDPDGDDHFSVNRLTSLFAEAIELCREKPEGEVIPF
jgi:hypothetical protein